SAGAGGREVGEGLQELPIDLLKRGPFQPRRSFDQAALAELAESIRAQGVLQPLVVREGKESEHYEIIAGERRWRAAQLAGLSSVPALVRDLSDEVAAAIGLIENLQREDLNPLEAAHALRQLVDGFGLSHQAAADAIGRSRTSITNLLRLLELNTDVQQWVGEGLLEVGHAKVLAGVDGVLQSEAARRVVREQLSVRQTEVLVRRVQQQHGSEGGGRGAEGGKPNRDPDVERLEEKLAERLGAEVAIQHSRRQGKGRLVIRYNSLEELDGILARIREEAG
ncbi:chromosome partitioning protein ParB, partial [Halorhodospira abdelmalekii]|uniref:ParB/RepB/Spo0J family partition protein n=1 Tax=Halorhodospira abdelmalekii TaxID=421629 RepID=UPI001905AC3D